MIRLSRLHYPFKRGNPLFNRRTSIIRGFSDFEEVISTIPIENIRNFSIIAHIDHGKSTLADRIIEMGANANLEDEQVLDRLTVEKERGITIKAQSSSLLYVHNDTQYLLNLVDTPGHADFAYEVERALKACEGACLIVDSTQGIQAQTMAHYRSSKSLKDKEKEIFGENSRFSTIPVMNKIDLPGADPELTELQVNYTMGLDNKAVYCSAKTGIGIEEVLVQVIEQIPPPISLDWAISDHQSQMRAFVFDSWFETNRGVYLLIRVFNGEVKLGDDLKISKMDKIVQVREVGVMSPDKREIGSLRTGQVGYILVSLKNATSSVQNLGATLINAEDEFSTTIGGTNGISPIPELIEAKQLVYASIYPEVSEEHTALKTAIDKLLLEDPALSVEQESSPALGTGFRCGFLGSLHLECFKQRLQSEFNIGCISTFPTVIYQAILPDGTKKEVFNPSEAPEQCEWEEPWASASIMCKDDYMDAIKKICISRRGLIIDLESAGDDQSELKLEIPMSEIITDFIDVLKQNSKGYASLDYDFLDFREAEIDLVSFYITNEKVEALGFLVHSSRSWDFSKNMCIKLKELIPRQLFQVAIQAKIRNKIIAAEHLKSIGKNVLARCYGGDYTRKQKLMKKQKEGKKKMRELGKVSVPSSTLNQIFK